MERSRQQKLEDGCGLGDLTEAARAPVTTDQIRNLDALPHLVQLDIQPPSPAIVTIEQTPFLSSAKPFSSTGILASPAASSSSPPPNSSVQTVFSASAEPGMEELLVCRPVSVTLLAVLPLSDWMKLRRVAHCWRDAVDQQLKSLKELNVCEMLLGAYWGDDVKEFEEKADSLLGFMSEKALAIQSLVIRSWVPILPQVLNRFGKLKQLDMAGAPFRPELFEVLESLTTLESLEAISLPYEPFSFQFHQDPVFQESFKDRLQQLIGRLNSLQSLNFPIFSRHPTLLEDLKNPEKLTNLFIKDTHDSPLLPTLQSLPRFFNLENLEIPSCKPDPAKVVALESALKQLKALRRLNLGRWELSVICVQSLSQLPHLERLTTMSGSLPNSIHWAQFRQLTCLELGPVPQSFIPCINQMTTLNCLKLRPAGTVNFPCSLPRLNTLCLVRGTGSFSLDFQPVCCNLLNLSLMIEHGDLLDLVEGLLNHNTRIRNLRIGWALGDAKTDLLNVGCMANSCKSLETLEFPDSWSHPSKGLAQVLSVFVDECPMLKNLKMNPDFMEAVKAMEKFRHLNFSTCSRKKDSWLF